MRGKAWLTLGLLIVGVVALATAARQLLSRGPLESHDAVAFEQDYSLSGVTDSGLVVLADTVNFDADSEVRGNAALIASEVYLNGRIDGDLTVLSDKVTLGPEAVVSGNVMFLSKQAEVHGVINGSLNMRGAELLLYTEPTWQSQNICVDQVLNTGGATVVEQSSSSSGHCDTHDFFASTQTLETLRNPEVILPLLNLTLGGAVAYVIFSTFASLALSGLSILAVVVFPRQISYIEEAIRRNPRGLGGTGFVILLLAAGVSVALGLLLVALPPLGIVIVPLYLLIVLLFCGMLLAGWITVTLIIGDLILQRMGRSNLPPLVIAAVGNISMLLAWNLLALNSVSRFAAFLVLLVLGTVGLGATFTTRLGTRPAYRSYLVQG